MYQESCPFCKIISGDAGAEILFESSDSVVFLDINPINFGHTLVVSRKHYTNFLELPEGVLTDLTHTLKMVSRAVIDSVHPAGFNIFNNNGVAAGQSVFHYHIAPRYDGDGLKVRPQVKFYQSPEQMAEYANRIREKIKGNYKSGEKNEFI